MAAIYQRQQYHEEMGEAQASQDPWSLPCCEGRLQCSEAGTKSVKVGFAAASAIVLVAVRVLFISSTPWSAAVTTLVGVCSQIAIQQVASKDIINLEKNFICDYNAELFLILTQIVLNYDTPLSQGIIYGLLNGLFGAQMVALVDTLANQRLDTDNKPTLDLQESSKHIEVYRFNDRRSRLYTDLFWGALGVGLMTTGYVISKAQVLTKAGWVFLGRAIGSELMEFVRLKRMEIERAPREVVEDDFLLEAPQVPPSVRYIRAVERVVDVVAPLLPALIIGLNHNISNGVAGILYGMHCQLDRIEYTRTDFEVLYANKLQPDSEKGMEKTCSKVCWEWAKLVTTLAMLTFIGAIIKTGTKVDRWVISPYTVAVLGSYFMTMYTDQKMAEHLAKMRGEAWEDQTLFERFVASYLPPFLREYVNSEGAMEWRNALYASLEGVRNGSEAFSSWIATKIDTSKLTNTAYFETLYSVSVFIFYLIVSQQLQLGDTFLNEYSTLGVAVSVFAYALLGWALGTHAAARSTDKIRPYPALPNLFLWFYSIFFMQQMFNQV